MRFRTWLLMILAAGLIVPADLPVTTGRDVAPGHIVARPGGFCPRGISWRVAEYHVGKLRKVFGPVRSTFFARKSRGRPTFLDLGRRSPSRQRFTVVIWGRNRPRFPSPPNDLYRGEFICVRGKIRLFEGVPQTFASRPGVIDVRRDASSGEGFGASARGGAGGPTCYVTTLADSGPGSLRHCLARPTPIKVKTNASTPRGWVVLRSPLQVPSYSSLDLRHIGIRIEPDGWPGGPAVWVLNSEHVVMRYVRVRPGPVPTERSESGDAIRIENSHDVIVDHSSFSWAVDEVFEVTASYNVTVQWSIIAEGLDSSTHYEGPHSRGLLVDSTSERVSIYRNLFAHNEYRNPETNSYGDIDIRGNVVYDYRTRAISSSDVQAHQRLNVVENYVIPGPETQPKHEDVDLFPITGKGWSLYLEGNTVNPDDAGWVVDSPFPAPSVPKTTSIDQVLDGVGVVYVTRDAIDARILADVRNGTGSLIDHPDEVGGWPSL